MITEQQIHQFHTFGFLVLKNMLNEEELKIVNEEFDKGLAKKDKGELIAGARVQLNWSNLESHSPFTASLLEDKRIYRVAQQLFGEDVVGKNSQANHYAGNRSPWHPDVGPNIHGCKFVFYLSPVDAETGALRVIPGSHRPEFSDRIKKVRLKDNDPGPPEDPGLAVNEVPFCSCDSQPGMRYYSTICSGMPAGMVPTTGAWYPYSIGKIQKHLKKKKRWQQWRAVL